MASFSALIKMVVAAVVNSPTRSTGVAVAAIVVSWSGCGGTALYLGTMRLNATTWEMPPGSWRVWEFEIGSTLNPEPTCPLTGRIVGRDGGNRDFDVLLLEEEPYEEWKAGGPVRGSFLEERRVTDVALNVTLHNAGKYRLVISNRFSTLTSKTVQAEAALNCVG